MQEQLELNLPATTSSTPAQGSTTSGKTKVCSGNCLGCALQKEHHLVKDSQGLIELAARENLR